MAAASSCLSFLSLYCLILMICVAHFPCVSSLSFSLDFSKTGDPCGGDLVCSADAAPNTTMIELTQPVIHSRGVVWYSTAVPLWNAVTGEVASFATTFSFEIMQVRDSTCRGDGMAFFLACYTRDRVLSDTYGAGLLGLFPLRHSGGVIDVTPVTGDNRVVAVEFDTVQNEWDYSSQHVGIDVNSIKSVNYTSTSSSPETNSYNLTSGTRMNATVHYDNSSKLLAADLWIGHTLYRVTATVDLKKELPDEVAIGFSAGTGDCFDLHRILSWSFRSTLQAEMATPTPTPAPVAPAPTPLPPAVNSESEPSTKLLPKVLIPIAASVSVFATVGLLVWLWRKHRRTSEANGNADFDMGMIGPRRYLYQELAAATDNFAEANKLGEGGFGSVYKGRLLSDNAHNGQLLVAIKRFSSSSSQGRKEFEAEVKIISQLSHRNLVHLFGWCDSPEGLLLVYELVPQGSLDKHIHNNERLLTWPDRYKIILGLGSALRYLHLDWKQCVVHGDIKPSNIMLDSSHNTKLGDFGLARLVDHGLGPQTTSIIRGSVGYMDPEFVNMCRRSSESDVYSFGIVLLEIVSGRQPMNRQEPSFMLPKWVWSLYSQDLTLEAADVRLRTTADDDGSQRQMERALVVGLWCAHPDPAERPSMAQALHVLQSEDARLPALSPQMYRQVAPPSLGVGESGAASSNSSSASGVGSASTGVTPPSRLHRSSMPNDRP